MAVEGMICDWLDNYPSDWKVIPLKRYFSFGKGLPITKADLVEKGEKVISYGQIHAKYNTGVHIDSSLVRFVPAAYLKTNQSSLCTKGDIIIADTSEDRDGCGNAVYVDTDEPVFAGYHTIILKSKEDNRYLSYLFLSDAWRYQIRKRVNGVKLFSITQKILSQCSILLPPNDEQQAIASYLDDRCSRLDEIITEAEKSIEEYKELKQAVIFEAVTKGLDKKVPMSPSNVGWIDTIPSSWNVGKLRLLAEFYNGDRSSRYPSGDDIQSEGIIFVTSNNLGGIKLNVDIATNKFITQEKYNELGGAKLQIDDIVFCLRGSVGKCSINKIFDAGTIASSLVVIRPKKVNPDYLNYVLQTSRITDEAIVSAIGIGSANLAAHDISEFFVPVPSEREQQEIANFLDVRIGDMDALISEKMSLIEDLQAYKKSLIYEVVTGKRRIS